MERVFATYHGRKGFEDYRSEDFAKLAQVTIDVYLDFLTSKSVAA